MPNNGEAQLTHERGRNLKQKLSQKCRINHHSACTSMRCECTDCDHQIGVLPERKPNVKSGLVIDA